MIMYVADKVNALERAQHASITDEYLRTSDVADLLGMSVPTVCKMIRDGKLQAFKPGRVYIIPAKSVRRFLEEHATRV